MITVKWTGAAGLSFEYQGGTILVDPYYTRISRFKMFFGKVSPDHETIAEVCRGIEKIRAIIVGHTHFDHALDLPVFAEQLKCRMIGSKSLSALMGHFGCENPISVCDGDVTIDIDPTVSVRMIPSEHGKVLFGKAPFPGEILSDGPGPVKASDYRMGDVFSPLIEINGTRFLHLGSAGFTEASLTDVKCDVLFLCVPGWENTEGYPERLLALTRPEKVVLFHFDDFLKPYRGKTEHLKRIKTEQLCDRIKKASPRSELMIPELFKPLVF